MEFYYPEEATPPECRVVLVLLSHRSEPQRMRKYGLGSWRTIDGKVAEWSIIGEASNFEAWGWYLVAWAHLPPVADLPEKYPLPEP